MRVAAIAMSICLGFFETALASTNDCSGRLDAPKAHDADQPVLVLVETDPWAMVLGSDSPRFALYESGLVIYRTKDGFRQTRLDASRALTLRNAIDMGALACLKTHYSTSDWTDQPSEFFFFGRGGRLSPISVYGSILPKRFKTDIPGLVFSHRDVPAPIVSAYERLVGFGDTKAKAWLPDFIEVMVWPYEYAPEPSIIWPAKWPRLNDPKNIKQGNMYSLYVPSKDYEELRAFLRTQHEKGAVNIDGRKWSVSLRFPFPREASWHFKVSDPE